MWYVYVAFFFAGVFLTNGIPHFIHGISGKRFQSPFASPPGVGESSPIINIIWGLVNFIIGYVLLYSLGDFTLGFTLDILFFTIGIIITAVALAFHFGRVNKD